MSDGRGDEDESVTPPPVPPPAERSEASPELPFAEESEPAEPAPIEALEEPEEPLADYSPVQVPAPATWPLSSAPRAMGPPPPSPPLPPLRERPLPELERLAPQMVKLRRKKRPLVVRIPILLLKIILIFILASVLWVAIYRVIAPPVTLTMIGDMIGGHSISKRWMPLADIDPSMARAAIAAEDSRFCSHSGFDFEAIEQAYARNATGKKRIRGGSTISQQTAKNVFLWQGGGYFRKGLEAWFTLLIEAMWGKKRIMEVYLNVAETGIGTYGVNAGSQRYFGHDASRMSAGEAAKIAAVLPLPKKRAGVAPTGYTQRYGKSIAGRIGTVRSDGLDSCLQA